MLKLAIVILVGYGLLVAAVYLMQGRMLYLPNMPGRTLELTPADAGMEYDDLWFETSDGVRLHGWFIRGPTDRVLLFFHGNAGNISHRIESIRQFLELGLSVMIIDYRGYGQSGGSISEAGINRDADAAWNYLSDVHGARDIVVFGRSARRFCRGAAGGKAAPVGPDRGIVVYVSPGHRAGALSVAAGALVKPPAACHA